MAKNTKKIAEVILGPLPEAPKPQTPHAWKVKQWKQTPSVQAELQRLLEHPTMQMAFQTLLLAVMPNAGPAELIPGVSAEAIALRDSQMLQHRSGMAALYRALHNLARPANTVTKQPQWGELLEESE